MRHLLPLSLLLNATLAAAGPIGRLPGAPVRPAVLPSMRVPLPVLPLTSLPGVSVPAANGGINLPGKPSPLPVPLPAELSAPAAAAPIMPGAPVAPAATSAAPIADSGEGFFMRWDLLDGEDDGLSPVFVPVVPGPKPLAPAGAMAELEYAADETPLELFDGGRTLVLAR
jgi:hypothetical protein